MPSVATVERHDENITPFARQLGWQPAPDDDSLIAADHIFIKHGYAPTPETISHLKSLAPDRVLVCGIQTDTCVLAAGFALFDAGLQPTLISDLTVGSSLDRSGKLGADLWRHHFKHVITHAEI
jgi:nicotinamidase-related amidase